MSVLLATLLQADAPTLEESLANLDARVVVVTGFDLAMMGAHASAELHRLTKKYGLVVENDTRLDQWRIYSPKGAR